jgi:hypothetical protein
MVVPFPFAGMGLTFAIGGCDTTDQPRVTTLRSSMAAAVSVTGCCEMPCTGLSGQVTVGGVITRTSSVQVPRAPSVSVAVNVRRWTPDALDVNSATPASPFTSCTCAPIGALVRLHASVESPSSSVAVPVTMSGVFTRTVSGLMGHCATGGTGCALITSVQLSNSPVGLVTS